MSETLRNLYVKLLEPKPTLPGSISEQYNVCGKANCRCKDKAAPRKHGPQLKLGFVLEGKSSTLVVKKSDKDIAILMNENFRELRQVLTAINDESLRIYKEVGAEAAYAQFQLALSDARAKALGAASATPSLGRLEESRDKWKAKAKERNERLRKNDVEIRDLSVSRDKWKAKAESRNAELAECRRRLDALQAAEGECDARVARIEDQLKKSPPSQT
jgi:chromosome segregation ATPase